MGDRPGRGLSHDHAVRVTDESVHGHLRRAHNYDLFPCSWSEAHRQHDDLHLLTTPARTPLDA